MSRARLGVGNKKREGRVQDEPSRNGRDGRGPSLSFCYQSQTKRRRAKQEVASTSAAR